MPAFGKTHRRRDILDGAASGGLIAGALVVWLFMQTSWIVPLAAFIIGIINTMDSLFPYGRQTFIYSWLFGLTLGTLAVILSSLEGMIFTVMYFCAVFFVIKLILKIVKR